MAADVTGTINVNKVPHLNVAQTKSGMVSAARLLFAHADHACQCHTACSIVCCLPVAVWPTSRCMGAFTGYSTITVIITVVIIMIIITTTTTITTITTTTLSSS